MTMPATRGDEPGWPRDIAGGPRHANSEKIRRQFSKTDSGHRCKKTNLTGHFGTSVIGCLLW